MGVFTFNGGVTTLRGGPSANQFNSFAQFLLGQTSSVVSEALPFDDNRMTSRQKSYSFYLQDQWQVTPQADGSLGLRWDYFPMGVRASRGHGALRLQHQPDVDLRRGRRSDRLRVPHRAEELFAARRAGLASQRIHGDPRRVWAELRSISAGVRAQHADELSRTTCC